MGARLRWVSLFVAGALLVAASPPSRTVRFTYQADQRMYSDFEREVARRDTPAGHLNSFGQLWFTSPGGSFELRIDDAGALPGSTVPVIMWSTRSSPVAWCMPSGVTQSFHGMAPGEEVLVIIDGATTGQQPHTHRCDGFGTVGTATVTFG